MKIPYKIPLKYSIRCVTAQESEQDSLLISYLLSLSNAFILHERTHCLLSTEYKGCISAPNEDVVARWKVVYELRT